MGIEPMNLILTKVLHRSHIIGYKRIDFKEFLKIADGCTVANCSKYQKYA